MPMTITSSTTAVAYVLSMCRPSLESTYMCTERVRTESNKPRRPPGPASVPRSPQCTSAPRIHPQRGQWPKSRRTKCPARRSAARCETPCAVCPRQARSALAEGTGTEMSASSVVRMISGRNHDGDRKRTGKQRIAPVQRRHKAQIAEQAVHDGRNARKCFGRDAHELHQACCRALRIPQSRLPRRCQAAVQ